MADKTRPGVMIYFEDYVPIAEVFDNEKLGEFFRALMNYAITGEWVSDDADPTLKAFLRMFKSKIDRDAERYAEKVLKRKYAVYCRETQKGDDEPLDYEIWKNHHLVSCDNTCYQSYPTATATATATPIAYATAIPTTTGKAKEKGCGGKERENPDAPLDFNDRRNYFIEQIKNRP